MTTFIYPNDETQNVTAEFVINERPILIQVKGLSENQSVILEYFYGDTCDGCWEPFKWCGKQISMCYPQNQLVLPALVGTYRLVMNEVDSNGDMVPFEMANWDDVEIQYNKLDKEFDMSALNGGCCCPESSETVTSVVDTGTGFVYINEDGVQQPITFPDTNVSGVATALDVDTGVLTVSVTEDGQTVSGNVDLMPFLCRWRVDHEESMVNLPTNTFTMDSTSTDVQALSTLANTFTVDPKDDGVEPYLEYAIGFQKIQDGADMNGRINFTMEYSVDGGPWIDLQQNGDYNLTGSILDQTEVEPSVRRQKIGPLSAGSHTVETRIRITQNSLGADNIFSNYRHTNRVEWSAMRFV